MTFATIFKFFKGEDTRDAIPSHFSDFFTNASEEKKEAVFTEAARMANEEQMKTFKKAWLESVN
jgi:hypothetical protein